MPKRNVVAISLPDHILRQLEVEAKKQATSRSEIIRRSLMSHFFVRDFTNARHNSIGELAKRGIHLTDDEVFDQIS